MKKIEFSVHFGLWLFFFKYHQALSAFVCYSIASVVNIKAAYKARIQQRRNAKDFLSSLTVKDATYNVHRSTGKAWLVGRTSNGIYILKVSTWGRPASPVAPHLPLFSQRLTSGADVPLAPLNDCHLKFALETHRRNCLLTWLLARASWSSLVTAFARAAFSLSYCANAQDADNLFFILYAYGFVTFFSSTRIIDDEKICWWSAF